MVGWQIAFRDCQTCLRYVDLPAMLGPVMMWKLEASAMKVSLHWNDISSLVSMMGWRPSTMAMGPAGMTTLATCLLLLLLFHLHVCSCLTETHMSSMLLMMLCTKAAAAAQSRSRVSKKVASCATAQTHAVSHCGCINDGRAPPDLVH